MELRFIRAELLRAHVRIALLECMTFAIPPVAIVIVNQVQVKQPIRSRSPAFVLIFCAFSSSRVVIAPPFKTPAPPFRGARESGLLPSSGLSLLPVRRTLLLSPLCMPWPNNISSSGNRGDS
jgi:hypothetical protein